MNIERYLLRIRREFPRLKFSKVRTPCQGMDHIALILDERWVFRFPKIPKYKRLFPSEVRLLSELHHRLPIRIPCYSIIAHEHTFGAYPLIKGKSLQRWRYEQLSAKTRRTMELQMANFLSALHTIPLCIARKYHVPEFRLKHTYQVNTREYRKYIRPKLNKNEHRIAEEYFQERKRHLSDEYTPALTHSDLYVDHILMNDKGTKIVGIIDFGDRAIHDPAADFAGLWEYGPRFLKNVYKHYKGPKDDYLLNRSQLYYKQLVLNGMTLAIRGLFGTFADTHRHFRKAFMEPLKNVSW